MWGWLRPIRFVLGFLVLVYDRMPVGRPIARTLEQQRAADLAVRGLVLYHLERCPFCVRVRRHLKRLGVELEMRDIGRDEGAARELVQGGGLDQVPCLRISSPGVPVRWLYESIEINAYLSEKLGKLS